MKRLAEENAQITGGARGIGLAFAHAYVAEGARVAIADLGYDRACSVAAELGGSAVAVEMDVSCQDSLETAVAETVEQRGSFDVLVNNAAIFTAAPIVEIERSDFDGVFSVNAAGVLITIQAVAQRMIDRGQGGEIINMASQDGLRQLPEGVLRPTYDRSALTAGIVHIGLGNFHRAHQAWYLHRLMQQGEALDRAIIGAGVRPFDKIQRERLAAQDYLTTLIELSPDGCNAEVVGSMIDFAEVGKGNAPLIARMDWGKVSRPFLLPCTSMKR